MTTQHRPRSDKSLHQPITDQPQEANSLEASSLEFAVKRSVSLDGKGVVEKLFVQLNHEFIDLYLVQQKGKANSLNAEAIFTRSRDDL